MHPVLLSKLSDSAVRSEIASAVVGNELQLVSDGRGLAIIGSASDVERFLGSSGLNYGASRNIDLHGLARLAGSGGSGLDVAAQFFENSGRWIKLTKESADNVRQFGLMPTKAGGVAHAMIGQPGRIKKWIQVAQAPGAFVLGPAALPMIATMLTQQSMQQQMAELNSYLEKIDEKVDDILRAQNDAILADMIGVDLIVEEAMTIRERVGTVSDVTWSKVQSSAMTLAKTQAYAIRQLDGLAGKLDLTADPGDIAKSTRLFETKVREWLAVLAHTVQLADSVSVLELDRVMDASPQELESHRLGLEAARDDRVALIARATGAILERMDAAIERANAKVLTNPIDSPALVRSSTSVAGRVLEFREHVGIDSDYAPEASKRWRQAVSETRDRVVSASVDGAAAAKRVTVDAATRTAGVFRAVDTDGDGEPDKLRIAAAADEAGTALKGAAAGVAGAFGTLFQRRKGTESAEDDASPAS